MEQRISIVTLGVADLARAKAFYEALGWQGQEVQETVFFQAGSAVLVLWGRGKLAADCGVPDAGAAAATAGATVTRAPAPTFYGGYAGVFADPDGHLWEIAHNPGFALTADGALILPDLRG